jgi:hypothetical protein
MCSKEEEGSPLKAIQKCVYKKTLVNQSINSGNCRQIAFDVSGIIIICI